jgi:hypothetical protein
MTQTTFPFINSLIHSSTMWQMMPLLDSSITLVTGHESQNAEISLAQLQKTLSYGSTKPGLKESELNKIRKSSRLSLPLRIARHPPTQTAPTRICGMDSFAQTPTLECSSSSLLTEIDGIEACSQCICTPVMGTPTHSTATETMVWTAIPTRRSA